MFNPMGVDRSFDQPYHYTRDLVAFTKVLVWIGLRPFRLKRVDNGMRQIVWAEDEEAVRYYAPGSIARIPMEKSTQVEPTDVIVMSDGEGGTINVNGTRII